MGKIEPGEWQIEVNQWGGRRRYRMIGNVKEYEGTVRIDGIDVPASEVEAFNKARAESQKKELDRARKETISAPLKACPFKAARNELNTTCRKDCVLFEDTGCVLAGRSTQDTQGAFCPICTHCVTTCALYQGGCTLTNFIKSIKGA